MARSATFARSICRLVLSRMVLINFLRPKMSAANEANLFCPVGQDILSFGLSAEPTIMPTCASTLVIVLDLDLHESIAQLTIVETLLSRSFRPSSRTHSQTKS